VPKASAPPAVPTAAALRAALEESYRGPAWHGPSLLVALRGVSTSDALRRPADGRHSIWELALHLAYGRHRVLGRLAKMNGRTTGRFPRARKPEWFPLLPEPADAAAWQADLELLERSHVALLEELERAPAKVLANVRPGGSRPIGLELLGTALHDAYHAGQIRLIAKMVRSA
jgi:uncharacterized damage-inducible protein DinB